MTAPAATRAREVWLLTATFLIAVAGLIYELIAATVSSYLLGDSVRQFSLVIGVFLSSMGLGAYLSRFVGQAMRGFIWAQIALGVVGGFMAPALFFAYGWTGAVAVPLYALLMAVGVLSGMEIPLIARVLKQIGAPEFRFENVLTVDYVGALAASVAFPLLVIPHLGLMSASLVFGCLNLLVAGLSLWLFRDFASRMQWGAWALTLAASLAALAMAERLVSVTEAQLFEDDVILSEATPYQKITVTRFRERTRLFLDHSIQFDTLDEHRYHEALVHPAMALAPRRAQVLILGGGDGMAAREALRWPDVRQITLVDLDPRVTGLFRDHPQLAPLNDFALRDARVRVINEDAWRFVESANQAFDVIVLDLPDPKTIALSKLYSRQFYALLLERLGTGGILVTQAGSPLFAPEAFWSVVQTLESTRNPSAPGDGLRVTPYHAYVPSFGDWGFAMATQGLRMDRPLTLPAGLRFLTQDTWHAAQVFDPETARRDVAVNDIQSHALLGYYLDGWDRWFR
ncbi:polyamine aminopropyltransferase [Lutimaribacter sp. EGI FJ00015]|uniref:Polyamine aminopropyltransferase n=1 Tax=Lutimaribacter degradans TaxID=2945989 RepID=A0ACC5ZYQ9_9RHOB|nr:polyamine aminopropyltransferase [Lutimaribacter sp. EGI FJ00013]MCO0614442.1 polyamine aminopropyltransferase [Lutimaribacter sp. EGI FJ00015]MCO0635957.1 polyamine aminopropyltransferase [Lutimaribacter sp. EGI FJ00014]